MTATDPDFAVVDQVEWLTRMDGVARDEFRDGLANYDYLNACRRLEAHFRRTERVRAHLDLVDGPAFGCGAPPDVDVAWEQVRLAWIAMGGAP